MPYRSAKQDAWMHIHEPEVAAKWDREYGHTAQPKPKARLLRKKRKKPAMPAKPAGY